MGFGIHMINCTQHPYGEKSLADVEGLIANEWKDFKSHHPFMEYNAAFWASSLDSYVAAFNKDKVGYTAQKFTSDDGKEYYSLLINPCGFVVLELISDAVTDKEAFTLTPK